MEVVLLGTKGGPRLSTDRIGPSQLIRHDGRVVLVDAGEGVVHQLLRAGVGPAEVQDVFITHHHCDHNVALGNVLIANWVSGGDQPITVYGPPPLGRIVHHLLEAHAYDIDTRVTDEGRVDLRKLVRVVELDGTQAPFAVAGLTARAAAVAHAPVEPALAYRFDSVGGRSVVVSGDTGPCDALVELARDADVLVHEVIHPEYVVPQEPSEVNTDWELLRRHLLSSHTSVHDLGGLAARAGVGTLVLSHLVPAGRVSDEDWLGPVRQTFGGQTVVGRDLMVVTAG
jgi:ribonuclease BN (tRNA processing enzyme)